MPYIHFKMETIQLVSLLIFPGCCLTSLDLNDPSYSVPIHQDHIKFTKFIYKNQLYMSWPKKIYKIDETTHS